MSEKFSERKRRKIRAIHETDEEYGRRVSAILAKEDTCEDRIDAALISRAEDFTEMWDTLDWERLDEYGLGHDRVVHDLLYMSKEARQEYEGDYIRYQISWGGPSEEIRFYPHKIEFVFADWFDQARRDITNLEWAQWIKDYLGEWWNPHNCEWKGETTYLGSGTSYTK